MCRIYFVTAINAIQPQLNANLCLQLDSFEKTVIFVCFQINSCIQSLLPMASKGRQLEEQQSERQGAFQLPAHGSVQVCCTSYNCCINTCIQHLLRLRTESLLPQPDGGH